MKKFNPIIVLALSACSAVSAFAESGGSSAQATGTGDNYQAEKVIVKKQKEEKNAEQKSVKKMKKASVPAPTTPEAPAPKVQDMGAGATANPGTSETH